MKKLIALFIVLLGTVPLYSGCSGETSEPSVGDAQAVIEAYTQNIIDNKIKEAYDEISDYDKENIDFDAYKKFRELNAKIRKMDKFSCKKSTKLFKDYNLLGNKYEKAVGFTINLEQEQLVPGIEIGDSYNQMAIYENDSWKVFLGYQDLDATINKYSKNVSEYENRKK